MHDSPTLLMDLYELTMAYGYWKLGMAQREAVFHHFYREQPFGGSYAVAAGLGSLIEFVDDFHFTDSDCAYLATLGLFGSAFLDYLGQLEFVCDIDAVPEGTFMFPHEPLVRVRGPLLQAQLLETICLNLINYQTLIATKAARLRAVCRDDELIEFGLRRAQGMDGGIAASRAAFVGGVDGVSNVEAGKRFGIQTKGTMAHSWVMAFDDELESFEAWAEVMPDNSVLLVDTYDTIQGVRNAAQVGKALQARGKKLLGIRLDSGSLLPLSLAARGILDMAGLTDTQIVASNELDEYRIRKLKEDGAPITVWGVGTRLVTGYDQPALGGVYKLGVIRDEAGEWSHRMKYAGAMEKTSEPGILQVKRFMGANGTPIGDVIYDTLGGDDDARRAQTRHFATDAGTDLLIPIYRGGRRVYEVPPLTASRAATLEALACFPSAVTRLDEPESYFVGTGDRLAARKTELMEESRARSCARRHSK